MKSRLAIALCALLTALSLSAALQAAADPAADSLQRRHARASAIDARVEAARQTWQSEYRTLLADYAAASERATQAQYNWRSERKRHRLRGDTKVEARDEIEASHESLARAMSAIREFHSRARSQGALPGWLYSVEDEFPDIASAVASR